AKPPPTAPQIPPPQRRNLHETANASASDEKKPSTALVPSCVCPHASFKSNYCKHLASAKKSLQTLSISASFVRHINEGAGRPGGGSYGKPASNLAESHISRRSGSPRSGPPSGVCVP